MPQLETPSDPQLLERVRASDPDALGQLYDRHAGYAMAVAYRIVENREEAEEVVQDVFWRLWKANIHYDPERGRFKTWLFEICRNRAIDSLRHRGRRPQADSIATLEMVAPGTQIERVVFERERSRTLQSAIEKLPEAQRIAIELSYYMQMTHREIAAETGDPVGTIKSRIHGGIAKLRESLAASGVTA